MKAANKSLLQNKASIVWSLFRHQTPCQTKDKLSTSAGAEDLEQALCNARGFEQTPGRSRYLKHAASVVLRCFGSVNTIQKQTVNMLKKDFFRP